ncbi:hypothetical protein GRX03_08770 [Halovenus sp. WSH3]|uniref:DUF7312 domain-containing protein n=1 Tax=Halovenus carboxidivorans TaxID=2692199 RepID=A0A6B0T7W1_9EURY|nr:hypothetical protein [Halovenus carboxidivorans]MXR51693.1 hypothetical protein [Halovenus carboxidivorans]
MAAPPGEIDDDDSDDEWRFSVEDVSAEETTGESDGSGGNIAGTLDRNQPLEPGEIDPENAVFVVLGVLIVVVLIAAAILGF